MEAVANWGVQDAISSSQIVTTDKPTLTFRGQMPFLSPVQQCHSTEGRKYHTLWTCSSQAHPGPSSLILTSVIPLGTLGEGCQDFRQHYKLAVLVYKCLHGTTVSCRLILPVSGPRGSTTPAFCLVVISDRLTHTAVNHWRPGLLSGTVCHGTSRLRLLFSAH